MKILVMGDLSGRAGVHGNIGPDRLSERAIYPLDIDDLDTTICRIAPELTLDLPDGQTVELGVRKVDAAAWAGNGGIERRSGAEELTLLQ